MIVGVLVFALFASSVRALLNWWAPRHTVDSGITHFYDIVEKDANEINIEFKSFGGKVIYGVNVASLCGLTKKGYSLISKISKIEGAQVLLFPCNQFGNQEPGTSSEVASFCLRKGLNGVIIFEKAQVNGYKTRPTYKFLKEKHVIEHVLVRNYNFFICVIVSYHIL
jgi:glutathione peroxidase-family protein